MSNINFLVEDSLANGIGSATPIVSQTATQTDYPQPSQQSLSPQVIKDINSTNKELHSIYDRVLKAKESIKEHPIDSITKLKEAHRDRKILLTRHAIQMKKHHDIAQHAATHHSARAAYGASLATQHIQDKLKEIDKVGDKKDDQHKSSSISSTK